MTKRVYFTVEGVGEFPFDMLRYDECWPCTGEDVMIMITPRHEAPRRRSVRVGAIGTMAPTTGRWESFNWRVRDVDRR